MSLHQFKNPNESVEDAITALKASLYLTDVNIERIVELERTIRELKAGKTLDQGIINELRNRVDVLVEEKDKQRKLSHKNACFDQAFIEQQRIYIQELSRKVEKYEKMVDGIRKVLGPSQETMDVYQANIDMRKQLNDIERQRS